MFFSSELVPTDGHRNRKLRLKSKTMYLINGGLIKAHGSLSEDSRP